MNKIKWYALMFFFLLSSTEVLAVDLALGTFSIGGSPRLSFASTNNSYNSLSSSDEALRFNIRADYYVLQNIGLSLGGDYLKSDSDRGSFSSTNIVFGAVFNISINPNMSVKLRGGFTKINEDDGDGSSAFLGVYLSYFIYPAVSLDLGALYRNSSFDYNSTGFTEKSKRFSLGLLGVTIYFI